RVEQQNFSIRKRTLEYDDVTNTQREIIYGFRSEVLRAGNPGDLLMAMAEDVVGGRAEPAVDGGDEEMKEFVQWADLTFPIGMKLEYLPKEQTIESVTAAVMGRVKEAYRLKSLGEDPQQLPEMERQLALFAIDTHWQEYLRNMDALRQGVSLRAYGQRDPLVEYKREAFDMFASLMDRIKSDVANRMFRSSTSVEALERMMRTLPRMMVHQEASVLAGAGGGRAAGEPPAAPSGNDAALQAALRAPSSRPAGYENVGRNDPCPCGSGKKFKKCHGANM
ncbi:MAG: SEC-C domain-containing protein, partial [Kiritimatiellae bacterium]|nr:SEC-C domain-containing protein [Kiritimatiellia bacterium]